MDELNLGVTGNIKGALGYGIDLDSEYDSNLFLTDGNEESDLALLLAPWAHYTSDPEGGANVTLTASYTPILRSYVNNSDLGGLDQSADASLTVRGAKTEISVFGRYSQSSGTDRLTGDFVEGTLMTAGIRASRQIAPRTSLNAGWSFVTTDYGSSSSVGAENYTTYFGGLWEVSPRLSLGPTLQYTVSKSDNIGDREAWALLLETRYKLGERIWLSTSLGPEFSTTTDAGSDTQNVSLTGLLTALYLINERWSWSNTFRSAAVPSPTTSNSVINDMSYTTELQRQLVRGSIGGGMAFSLSSYEDVGTVTTTPGNEKNFSVFLTYRHPLFSERLDFDSTLRYTVNDGSVDWSQLQLQAGIKVVF